MPRNSEQNNETARYRTSEVYAKKMKDGDLRLQQHTLYKA